MKTDLNPKANQVAECPWCHRWKFLNINGICSDCQDNNEAYQDAIMEADDEPT